MFISIPLPRHGSPRVAESATAMCARIYVYGVFLCIFICVHIPRRGSLRVWVCVYIYIYIYLYLYLYAYLFLDMAPRRRQKAPLQCASVHIYIVYLVIYIYLHTSSSIWLPAGGRKRHCNVRPLNSLRRSNPCSASSLSVSTCRDCTEFGSKVPCSYSSTATVKFALLMYMSEFRLRVSSF